MADTIGNVSMRGDNTMDSRVLRRVRCWIPRERPPKRDKSMPQSLFQVVSVFIFIVVHDIAKYVLKTFPTAASIVDCDGVCPQHYEVEVLRLENKCFSLEILP